MRHTFIQVSIALLLIAVYSCNDSGKNQKVIKSISFGQIDYKILKRSFGTNVNTDATKLDTSNGYFLQVDLIIHNNSSSPIKFDTSFFKLTNDKGDVFPFSTNMDETIKNFEQSLYTITIDPKTEKKGYIIFNVPTIADYKLQLNSGDWSKEKSEIDLKQAE